MLTVSPRSGANSRALVKEAFLFSDGSVMNDFDHTDDDIAPGRRRQSPIAVSRHRTVERAGRLDRATMAIAPIVGAILAATAIFDDAWAWLPLGTIAIALVVMPRLVQRRANPEVFELIGSLCVTIAMATAAGLTGGTSSPIVFLLPIGVVLNGLRAGRTSILICSAVTAAVFVLVSLLEEGAAIVHEPLPMIAILAMQLGVTIASVALAEAEIGHRRASIVDPLTGLLNRHGLPDRFEELRRQALVSRAPITVVLFDLDHFKRLNDLHGHDVGDRLLREVADQIRTSLRRFDLVYRVGGEEFLILLPGMAEEEGEMVAEELRFAIEQLGLVTGYGITASFGVSGAAGAEIDFDWLYRQADQALYGAKRSGRDRVRTGRRPLALSQAGPQPNRS
jgi:diguanylate cyclase (GGDEF)-like protein